MDKRRTLSDGKNRNEGVFDYKALKPLHTGVRRGFRYISTPSVCLLCPL